MKKSKFSPLLFLASLGAGGIAIIPFALFNYTIPHKGLIQTTHLLYETFSLWQVIFFRTLEGIMILFIVIHLILSVLYAIKFVKWLKNDNYQKFIDNPLVNSAILAPFISIIMTMNVVIWPVRYFIPYFSNNVQAFMLPALILWIGLWILIMRMEIKLLRISFEKTFNFNKINFGWLLHPFVLAMLTVTGTGFAAISTNPNISNIAAFMSVISGSMGFFLLVIETISLFQSHFAASGLPEREFLPSFLIVVPNITLFAISAFRLGHYLEYQHHFDLGAYFMIIMVVFFAFETWYLVFGISLLKNYFKKYFFKEYYDSQWGLICPFVAYAVLGSIVYKVFVPNIFLYNLILFTMVVVIILFFILLKKQFYSKNSLN